jgi:anaerobic ribonucleoside-triphosphate reductase activating protein
MRYFGIIKNDVVNTKSGFTVSLFTQGCDRHCPGCHNSEAWDFNGGYEKNVDLLIKELYDAIKSNGIHRSLSILGGEPLAEQNKRDICYILSCLKTEIPDLKVYLWTGYTKRELDHMNDGYINVILGFVDVLIDGPFEQDKRDITLPLRGSSNQDIYERDEFGDFVKLT